MEMKICVSVCELAQRLDNFEDYLDNRGSTSRDYLFHRFINNFCFESLLHRFLFIRDIENILLRNTSLT